jgi:hypothetical protein
MRQQNLLSHEDFQAGELNYDLDLCFNTPFV